MSHIALVRPERHFDQTQEEWLLNKIPVESIIVGRFTLREQLDEESINSLAHSIRHQGMIQPLVVRARKQTADKPQYDLIVGERRFNAALIAGLDQVPARIVELSDREAIEFALMENLEREDLNSIEEALTFQRLIVEHGLRQTDIADLTNQSRAAIANTIRLLDLPEEVIELIRNRQISAGHGRALLRVQNELLQLRLARRAARQGTSVRSLEQLVLRLEEKTKKAQENSNHNHTQLKRLEQDLSKRLNSETKLALNSHGQKRLTITFANETSWKRFMRKLSK